LRVRRRRGWRMRDTSLAVKYLSVGGVRVEGWCGWLSRSIKSRFRLRWLGCRLLEGCSLGESRALEEVCRRLRLRRPLSAGYGKSM
jgi:hypothetical protein